MDTIINWFRGLSRNAQIGIIIALAVFTPVVSVVFSIVFGGIGAIFTVLGFVLGYVNWGIATLLLLGYGGFVFYRWINSEDESEEEEDNSWDPFR
jgi:uncharacterized membrane protein